MIKINEVHTVSVITRSKLPHSDFVINPYIGCLHGCKYCYANFMKKFTGHLAEEWGDFVDVKIDAVAQVKIKEKLHAGKVITIGSVTDPYQAIEKKYQITRGIIEKLIPHQPDLYIMTKSALITRDLALIKQIKNCTVVMSLSHLDDNLRKIFEPLATPVVPRIAAIKAVFTAGIKVVLFISPILPYLTDWQMITTQLKDSVYEVWFENLNFYPSIRGKIFGALMRIDKNLIKEYKNIYAPGSNYWLEEQKKIEDFCRLHNIPYTICFHDI